MARLPFGAGQMAIGDYAVAWIPEVVNRPYDATFIYPDSTPETIAPHLEWLAPRFYNVERKGFVLNTHTFVLKTEGRTILIDSCIGNDKTRTRYMHLHKRKAPYLEHLALVGVEPEQVDFVMCTHLHIDHVGWNTRLHNGRWVPTFPNARYLFSRAEFEHTQREAKTNPQSLDGSFEDSVLPLLDAGKADLLEGEHAVGDELRLMPTPGHSPGHIAIELTSRGSNAVFSGDIVHNPIQYAEPDWNSVFCHDAEAARSTRRAFLERYADTATVVLPAHFPAPTAGRIAATRGAWKFRELVGLR